MKLINLSLFAFTSGFSIPSTLQIRSSSTSRDDLHRLSSNHLLRETKLLYSKIPLISRNESNSNVDVEDADAFMLGQAHMSDVDIEMPGSPTFLMNNEADALFASLNQEGKVHHIHGREDEKKKNIMRPPPDSKLTSWDGIKRQLMSNFGFGHQELEKISQEIEAKESLLSIYSSMQLARQFEATCNQKYMANKIRGESSEHNLIFSHFLSS